MQITSLRPTTRLRCLLIAIVGLLSAHAFADTFSVNTQVYGPSFQYGINTDVLNAYNFGTQFNPTNQSFQFQPFSLDQGFEPPPPGFPSPSPYVTATGSFSIIDQVTLTEYNNVLQPVDTSSKFVELDFQLLDDPNGTRILTLLPSPLLSFGDGINLLISAPSLWKPNMPVVRYLVHPRPSSSFPPLPGRLPRPSPPSLPA